MSRRLPSELSSPQRLERISASGRSALEAYPRNRPRAIFSSVGGRSVTQQPGYLART